MNYPLIFDEFNYRNSSKFIFFSYFFSIFAFIFALIEIGYYYILCRVGFVYNLMQVINAIRNKNIQQFFPTFLF